MHKTNQLVSIIITTYNRQDIIHLALDSCLRQTYQNWEAWVCDDGSTDETRSVVAEYMKRDKRFNYINNGHQDYYTINRNQGIEASDGELLAFFDDDSVHHPQFLEEHIRRHLTEDVLLTYSGRYTVLNDDPAKYTYEQVQMLPMTAIPLVQYRGNTEDLNGTLDVGDYVIKRSSFKEDFNGFVEEKDQPSYCSDLKLVDKLLHHNPEGKIVMIPRRLHVNFMHGHDHMTKRKLESREDGKLGDEEELWKF